MPISKWNRLVYELDICKELEEVQWSRSSGGTQWRFPIMSFSKLYSVHPIIRDKMVPSLFEEWKKKVLTDSCCCYFLFPHKGKEPHFLLKKWLSALGNFESGYTNVSNNLLRNAKNANITSNPDSSHQTFLWVGTTVASGEKLIKPPHLGTPPTSRELRTGVCPAPDTLLLLPGRKIPPLTNF